LTLTGNYQDQDVTSSTAFTITGRLTATACSRRRDRDTGPGALVAEQADGERRDTGVADIPDRGPGVRRQPGSGIDVVRDAPERRDVRDALVAGEIAAQQTASLRPGQLDGCRRGGARAGRRRGSATAARGKSRHGGGDQQGQAEPGHAARAGRHRDAVVLALPQRP